MRCTTLACRLIAAAALLLTLTACILIEQPSPPPPPPVVVVVDPGVEQRNQASTQLSENVYLDVSEHNGDLLVQIPAGNLFRLASVNVDPKAQPIFEHIAKTLAPLPLLAVRVIGHTDNVGVPQQNLALSIRRAQNVRNALVALGLDAHRVTYEGRGDTEPQVPNTTPETWAVNRRVELLISVQPALATTVTPRAISP